MRQVMSQTLSHMSLFCSLDPFAYVSFLNRSQQSETIKTTLSPTWDQTLIFDEIEIFGDPQIIAANPPEICIEVFDFDSFVSLTLPFKAPLY